MRFKNVKKTALMLAMFGMATSSNAALLTITQRVTLSLTVQPNRDGCKTTRIMAAAF